MKQILTTLTLILCMWGTAFAEVIYVDAAAANGGNGQTWATAYNDLQTAMKFGSRKEFIARLWIKWGMYLLIQEIKHFTLMKVLAFMAVLPLAVQVRVVRHW